MKQGWLIVNGYLESEKFDEIYSWLIDAAEKNDCKLRKLTNDQVLSALPVNPGDTDWKSKPDFIIFWDKDVRLAYMLEEEGFEVFNSADAIEICDDKARTYIELQGLDVATPKTFVAPLTFDDKYSDYTFLMQVEQHLGYPMVIKETKGSFGEQVYLANNFEEAKECIDKIGNSDFIMQEYIESSKGRDIRLQVVGDKVVTAMERTNENDFRANVTNGGEMKPYTPTKKQEKMALEVCEQLGVDFAGVDILFGKNEDLLCEVNSNAHFKNIYDCTGVNVAEAIIEHILKEID